jgi:hypothetical protein
MLASHVRKQLIRAEERLVTELETLSAFCTGDNAEILTSHMGCGASQLFTSSTSSPLGLGGL